MVATTSFFEHDELLNLGLKGFGDNVQISRFARFYSPSTIELGDNVRIDDFCILSGNIKLGSNIHISAYCALYGSDGIIMEDNTGLSPKALLFSAMDDFSGDFLIGPIHKKEDTNVTGGCVYLEKYSHVGSGSIVFPNLKIAVGSVIGAMSIVKYSVEEWGIYAGIPVRRIKNRNKNMLDLL